MKLFPVVHLGETSIDHSIEQANLAFDLGADGVYLIDHFNGARDTDRLYEAFHGVKSDDLNRYVGLNILGLGPREALARVATAFSRGVLITAPDDMWVDDVRDDTDMPGTTVYRQQEDALRFTTLHGGVAFKYTETVDANPASETSALKDFVDVITTSGAGTGKPPTVEKLQAMHDAAEGVPIAVASGIDIDNIASFEGIVNEVLASSSVETRPGSGVFEHEKLRDLIQAAHDLAR